MRVSFAAAAAAVLVIVLGIAPGAGAKDSPSPRAAAAAPVAPDAGGNHDKVFDDLAAKLGGLAAADRVNVIVTLRASATLTAVDALSQAVGGFSVSRRFTLINAFSATMTKQQALQLAARSEVAHVEQNAS